MLTTETLSTSEPVVLRGGLTVSRQALALAWRLEDAGVQLFVAEDGRLRAGPASLLTASDRLLIRAHKTELLELVRYGGDDRLIG